MNLSTRQLNAFAAVARARNFTRAGEQVHLTQAGLSLAIREMETQLGCRLFDRTTRSVRLTEAGARLLPFAERTLRELAEVGTQLGQLSASAARTVSVAATPLVASSVLPAVCRDLAARHPEIRVRIKDADRRQIQALVESGEVDVGLGILFEAGTNLSREPVARIPLVCVSARGALAPLRSRRGGLSWASLRKTPLLCLPPDNAIQQRVDATLGPGHVAADRPTFANLHTLIAMAEIGAGAAILPAFVAPACRRYEVDVDEIAAPNVPMEFFAVMRKGSVASPAVGHLLQALRPHLNACAKSATKKIAA